MLPLFINFHLEQPLNREQTSFTGQDPCDFREHGETQLISGDRSVPGDKNKSTFLAVAGTQVNGDRKKSDDHSLLHNVYQVADLELSQSTASIDDLLSYPYESCMEDFSEGDVEDLVSNLERMQINAECQSYIDLGKTEDSKTTDITQSSDMEVVIKEPLLSFPQINFHLEQPLNREQTFFTGQDPCDFREHGETQLTSGDRSVPGNKNKSTFLAVAGTQVNGDGKKSCDHSLLHNVYQVPDEKEEVEECIEPQVLHQDYSSQLCESEVGPNSPIMLSGSEVSICERTEQVISKSPSLLDLLLLNSTESHQGRITIKKMLRSVWKMIATHRFAGSFMTTVTERQAPGYKGIVKRPMDLTTIKRGISKRWIKTKAEFQRDLLLMLLNCVMYNNVHQCVHQKALEMQRDVVELLKVFNLKEDQRS